jgi:hypothetical protein
MKRPYFDTKLLKSQLFDRLSDQPTNEAIIETAKAFISEMSPWIESVELDMGRIKVNTTHDAPETFDQELSVVVCQLCIPITLAFRFLHKQQMNLMLRRSL